MMHLRIMTNAGHLWPTFHFRSFQFTEPLSVLTPRIGLTGPPSHLVFRRIHLRSSNQYPLYTDLHSVHSSLWIAAHQYSDDTQTYLTNWPLSSHIETIDLMERLLQPLGDFLCPTTYALFQTTPRKARSSGSVSVDRFPERTCKSRIICSIASPLMSFQLLCVKWASSYSLI